MGSITNSTKKLLNWIFGAEDVPKPTAKPIILPLQDFLDKAYEDEKINIENVPNVISGTILVTKKLAISIRAIQRDDNRFSTLYAEIPKNPPSDPMHYSGSLVKVAAVYAAFDLRAAARVHANSSNFATPDSFFSSLNSVIDTSTAVQPLKTFGKGLKPSLKEIFVFDNSAPNKVVFIKKFSDALKGIFHNESATICIDALGYSYINVSLMRGGFFNPNTLTGIWLAGDYSKEVSLESIRVPCLNDTVPAGSGQAITTKEMSRMFFVIHTKQAYPYVSDSAIRVNSNEGAHNILKSQVSWFINTTPGVAITVPIPFTVDCTKVGIGGLGPVKTPGAAVYSEAEVLVWTDTSQVTNFNTKFTRQLTGEFVVCWQNLYQLEQRINPLITMINSAIQKFLAQ